MPTIKEKIMFVISESGENRSVAAKRIGISKSYLTQIMNDTRETSPGVNGLIDKAYEEIRKGGVPNIPNTKPAPPEDDLHRVPVISWVRAGLSDNFAQDYSDSEHQIEEWFWTDCKDPTACALIVEGDSMEPEYYAGDRIVASPRETPRPNDLVVARLKSGEMFFKKFKPTGKNSEEVLLLSNNKAHETLQYPRDKFAYIYPVVDMRRKPRR